MQQRAEIEESALSRVDRPDISASEIGDYAYCARSWWLKRVAGMTPQSPQLDAGTAVHAAAGRVAVQVVQAERTVRRLAWVLVAVALAGVAAVLLQ